MQHKLLELNWNPFMWSKINGACSWCFHLFFYPTKALTKVVVITVGSGIGISSCFLYVGIEQRPLLECNQDQMLSIVALHLLFISTTQCAKKSYTTTLHTHHIFRCRLLFIASFWTHHGINFLLLIFCYKTKSILWSVRSEPSEQVDFMYV